MGALGGCAERPNAGKAMAASLGSGAWHQAPTWMLTHHLQNHVPAVAQSKQRCQGAPTQPGLFSSFVGISWLLSTVSQKCDTHHLQRGRRFLQATGSIQAWTSRENTGACELLGGDFAGLDFAFIAVWCSQTLGKVPGT